MAAYIMLYTLFVCIISYGGVAAVPTRDMRLRALQRVDENAPFGYDVQEVAGDGNCFLWAVLNALGTAGVPSNFMEDPSPQATAALSAVKMLVFEMMKARLQS